MYFSFGFTTSLSVEFVELEQEEELVPYQCQKRPNTQAKETYCHCLSVKRDLIHRQKRPNTQAKET
jgi:hypothetical protein